MKKLLTIFILGLISFLFIGCGSNPTTSLTSIETTSPVVTTTENATTTVMSTTDTTTQPITTTQATTQPATTTTEQATTTLPTTTYDASRYQKIDLYSLNDFHGGAYTSFSTISNIGETLINIKGSEDDAIILSDGDIFQGTALSNYYHGRPLIDIMDYIGFDGFVIGNHEFDWGIDEIAAYADGDDTNGEASFPFLAANIVYTDSGEPLDFTVPYITKDINGVKVGIIGIIGDIIDSISASRVQNITFENPIDTVYKYADILRTDENCDVVVVYAHDGSGINPGIAAFSGSHLVDAIFNGHTHADERGIISRMGTGLAYAQSSNKSDSVFQNIKLVYDKIAEKVISANPYNFSLDNIPDTNTYIDGIISSYENEPDYVSFVSEDLGTAASTYSKYQLAPWGASVIKDYMGVDVGALNAGGFRVNMNAGSITMGDLITIYPFDNYIKTSEMTGAQLLTFYKRVKVNGSYDLIFDQDLFYENDNLYIDGNQVQPDQIYTVAAVDYVFDKDYYDFLLGDNIVTTTYLMRDLLAEDLVNAKALGAFSPDNGTSYPQQALGIFADPFQKLVPIG